jgi:hypothetical protein
MKDILGNTLAPGDRVAFANLFAPYLRTGVIAEMHPHKVVISCHGKHLGKIQPHTRTVPYSMVCKAP